MSRISSAIATFVTSLLSTFLVSCTSILVEPMNLLVRPQVICIVENPEVLVEDFVIVLRDGIARHNMKSEVILRSAVIDGVPPAYCDLVMAYTARRSWDFVSYLATAEIWLEKGGKSVGYADYHLIGGGGLSLMKWMGTKSKLDPVIDQLFTQP